MFKEASYTVLGDLNQALEREVDQGHYDHIARILGKEKSSLVHLHRSYRSSYEINTFAQKLLKNKQHFLAFNRHEAEPDIAAPDNLELLDQAVARQVHAHFQQGYESVAIICKTMAEAEAAQRRLGELLDPTPLNLANGEIEKGVVLLPAYLAKGLEFDAVIVYNASQDNYASELDRKLLYLACTRALHRLTLYYTGIKSQFIPD